MLSREEEGSPHTGVSGGSGLTPVLAQAQALYNGRRPHSAPERWVFAFPKMIGCLMTFFVGVSDQTFFSL